MNSELRKWLYKRNMLRNVKKTKNPNKQNYDLYRKAREMRKFKGTLTAEIFWTTVWRWYKKTQFFWPTIKPFLSNKSSSTKDVMLFANDCIIADTKQVANVLNRYFTEIALGIGFNDPIPDGYTKSTMTTWISKYDSHPRITAIKRNVSSGQK